MGINNFIVFINLDGSFSFGILVQDNIKSLTIIRIYIKNYNYLSNEILDYFDFSSLEQVSKIKIIYKKEIIESTDVIKIIRPVPQKLIVKILNRIQLN